jgi:8-amino-7-oxononanoate synthase
MPADPLRHLDGELHDLETRGLLRRPPTPLHRAPTSAAGADAPAAEPLVLCSNDYLGYASDPWPATSGNPSPATSGHPSPATSGHPSPATSGHPSPATSGHPSPEPAGSGASRLVSGEHPAHASAERAIAAWLRTGASLLFSSGYAANVGTIAALARPGDLVVSDALNHASIIDGCRLSGARVVVVPHGDPAAVERALAAGRDARCRWVLTESYFSMDGDSPDLRALRSVCDAHDAALYVDEAHAVGVFGPEGRGLCAEAGITPDILVGTFGKALGLQGAFVAGSPTLRLYLWNRARSFVFSTGISPALAASIEANVLRAAADERARERLHATVSRLRAGLSALGVPLTPAGRGPVIPWVVGSSTAAVTLSTRLREQGVLVQAIRPPTVPPDTARLRITATARLTERDIDRALQAFEQVLG